MVRIQRVTFLALHNYLGLGNELITQVSSHLNRKLHRVSNSEAIDYTLYEYTSLNNQDIDERRTESETSMTESEIRNNNYRTSENTNKYDVSSGAEVHNCLSTPRYGNFNYKGEKSGSKNKIGSSDQNSSMEGSSGKLINDKRIGYLKFKALSSRHRLKSSEGFKLEPIAVQEPIADCTSDIEHVDNAIHRMRQTRRTKSLGDDNEEFVNAIIDNIIEGCETTTNTENASTKPGDKNDGQIDFIVSGCPNDEPERNNSSCEDRSRRSSRQLDSCTLSSGRDTDMDDDDASQFSQRSQTEMSEDDELLRSVSDGVRNILGLQVNLL